LRLIFILKIIEQNVYEKKLIYELINHLINMIIKKVGGYIIYIYNNK